MNFIEELRWRGMLQDMIPGLEDQLAKEMTVAYIGFDPTAPSLHIGNLAAIMLLKHFQLCGHKPIALVGGATGMIGDPSGKAAEREFLSEDTLRANQIGIQKQLEKFLEFHSGANSAEVVNNYDWFKEFSFLGFLREAGKFLTVNYMMSKDSVKKRLETGISFTEFSYQLLQGYDFYHLYKNKNVRLQMGGSDQWGNITAGIDLIRKSLSRSAFGATWPLVTKSDGTKFGKTAGGAVWLDAQRTSPYQFRQFWMQMADADVVKYLPQFSLASMNEVSSLLETHLSDPGKRIAQRTLATELTVLVHGADAARDAEAAAEILFGGDPNGATREALQAVASEVPNSVVTREELEDVFGLLARSGVASSTSDARRSVEQGGIKVNGQTLEKGETLASKGILHDRWVLVRKGKTTYHVLTLA